MLQCHDRRATHDDHAAEHHETLLLVILEVAEQETHLTDSHHPVLTMHLHLLHQLPAAVVVTEAEEDMAAHLGKILDTSRPQFILEHCRTMFKKARRRREMPREVSLRHAFAWINIGFLL